MATIATRCLVVTIALAVTAAPAAADEPKGGAKDENKLVGTWKLVSAKYGGRDASFLGNTTTLKHVTPTQFMWATYGADGKVTRTAGGAYTLNGETYEETPEYGLGSDFGVVKAKAQTFKWTVEGNKWHHTGKLSNGLTIEEVWERVERK
jgi:hypothetical protein